MERDAKIDNLKAFLIFTVVFGHSLEFLCGTDGAYGAIRAIIYAFHMPTFVFLSGYLSKKSKKPLSHVTILYLISYVLFNTLFGMTPWRLTSPYNVLFPQYVYWYLISLVTWRICTPVLSRIKIIIPVSFIFVLYIGFFGDADRFLSISRTICFFPFFIVGHRSSMERIKRINKHVLSLLLILCIAITIIVNRAGIIPVKMYEYIESYATTGVENIDGVMMRIFLIIISFIMVVCLIGLAPSFHNRLTIWGKNSLTIYLLHLFVIKAIGHFALIQNHFLINTILCFFLSAVICIFLSMQFITNAYNGIINKIADALTIDC